MNSTTITKAEFDEQDKLSNAFLISLGNDPILPNELLVVCENREVDSILFTNIAKKSMKLLNQSKIAVLLIPSSPVFSSTFERMAVQLSLPVNIITVDAGKLLEFCKSNLKPRDSFTTLVLEQSDLKKISPFVLTAATPRRMFFGREKEEATLLSTLSSNSVAVLGSRKIGKTSLLSHVFEALKNAGYAPYFADCQTVKNWKDFGDMAEREWKVRLSDDFRPQHLFDLTSKFKKRSKKKIVILLDEIDHLLFWDMQQKDDQVPEAFFRTCRTLSQEGTAQFVFSGERTIAQKLWDPQSPHWNFCRPLALQQLDRDSTEKLLIQPLQSLQVEIQGIRAFKEEIWKVTTGHPQIAQFLGDQLVSLLNKNTPNNRRKLTLNKIEEVTETFEYKDHYISTYWGQATDIEKFISLLITREPQQPANIINVLEKINVSNPDLEATNALRMLDLYGIVSYIKGNYQLRATWFSSAITAYGTDLNATISRYQEKLK
jgi:hypothetical protein